MPTPEEKAKADEKDRADKAAAAIGAKAVADAVAKVANAAVDAVVNAAAREAAPDLIITGTPGGKFEIRGDGFSSGGSVLIGGAAQFTTEWGAQYIRGKLDANVKSGEVVVQIDPHTKRTGYLKVA